MQKFVSGSNVQNCIHGISPAKNRTKVWMKLFFLSMSKTKGSEFEKLEAHEAIVTGKTQVNNMAFSLKFKQIMPLKYLYDQ